MTVYNPSIPQPQHNLSVSQGDILANFTQLNTQFGVDHTAFEVAGSNGNGFHKKATMPDTASVSPGTSYGTYYASKTGISGANITEAVYKSGDAAPVSILSAVKCWGLFTGITPAIVSGFNFSSVARYNGQPGQYLITMTNAMDDTNYGIIATSSGTVVAGNLTAGGRVSWEVVSTTQFRLYVESTNNGAQTADANVIFAVIKK